MNWNEFAVNSYWHDSHRILFNKECRAMSELPDESVQMVVTSPPYWGLRKYSGNQDLIWGGELGCRHQWGKELKRNTGTKGNNLDTLVGTQTAGVAKQANTQGSFCSLCGAWKGAYGLEPTPELYVQHTIEILREIRRVLRKDGVVFWDIGDSYAGSGKGQNAEFDKWNSDTPKSIQVSHYTPKANYNRLKPKDLCLIPFRVAIAAQEDGWWCRSVIIWNKPNPMPESVTDRPTESHEYILMLTKSSRYYWDQEAVREPLAYGADSSRASAFNNPDVRKDDTGEQTAGITTAQQDAFYAKVRSGEITGRNLRSVWTFPTQPYPEAHFATYPEKLVEICVKAASKIGDIVLDPFAGSGTTLKVAAELNRRAIGYELSEPYCQLIIDRNKQQVLI